MKKIMLLSVLLLAPQQFFGKAKRNEQPSTVQLSNGQLLALTLSPWAAAAIFAFLAKRYWECEKNSLLRMPAQFERVETVDRLPGNSSSTNLDELGDPIQPEEPKIVLVPGGGSASKKTLG